jgi:hypothetical protein
MNELVKIALSFLKKKIGIKGVLLIGFFALGVFIATTYSNYIVTPDTLQQSERKLNTKMDKSSAKFGINIAEMELASLRKEKAELEDRIDEKPKRRYTERLREVNERIKELESDKKELLKTLETK